VRPPVRASGFRPFFFNVFGRHPPDSGHCPTLLQPWALLVPFLVSANFRRPRLPGCKMGPRQPLSTLHAEPIESLYEFTPCISGFFTQPALVPLSLQYEFSPWPEVCDCRSYCGGRFFIVLFPRLLGPINSVITSTILLLVQRRQRRLFNAPVFLSSS